MAALQKQFVINLADLRLVSIECKNCLSILTLDMENLSKHQEKYGLFLPSVCSACQQPFDTATQALHSFRNSYAELRRVPERITFRGECESVSASREGGDQE